MKDLESYFKPKQEKDVLDALNSILEQLILMNEKLDKLTKQPQPSPS